MPAAKDVVLCRYHYDPLDRLVGHSPAGADSVQRFYQKNRLATEIQGLIQRSIVQAEDQLLAQHEGGNCTLLATDQQRSVLHELTAPQQRSVAYTPYGFRSQQLDLPGFNGEQPDPVTGHYLLGNGYRAFNPVLMRFNSPDSLSPFGEGGLNAYAYCVGDPVNRVDPSGHTPSFLKAILRGVGLMRKNKPANNIQMLDNAMFAFEDFTGKAQKRLNVLGHGYPIADNGYHPMVALNKKITPDHLDYLLKTKGYQYENYASAQVIACYSANGNSASFAAEFSKLSGLPTTGYKSQVTIRPGPDELFEMVKRKSTGLRKLSNGNYQYAPGVKIYSSNPYKLSNPNYMRFSYNPRTFETTDL